MLTPLRVLIAEDNKDDVLLIMRALKKGGYDPEYLRVETAKAMRNALRRKPWEVILCNYNLPGFSVPGAMTLLTEEDLDIPLIVVSGIIGEEAAVECMRLGARDCIRKENLSLLIPAINRELAETKVRTSLNQIELEWRKSWDNYRLIMETIHDFIITADFNWKVTYANKAFRNLLGGLDPVGLSITALTPPELLEKQQTMMQRRTAGYAGTSCYEWEIIATTGHRVTLDVQSQLFNENGKAAGVLFIARNITERKKEAEALKESEEKYRLVVENAREGILITQDAKLVFVNRPAQELTNYSGKEISSRSFIEFIHPVDRDLVLNNHFKRLRGEEVPDVYPFRVIDGTGQTRWIELKSKLITWKKKPAVLNFLTDITERLASEEAKKNLLERLDLATSAAKLGVWDRDLQSNQMVWNDRMYELYGMNKENFTATHEAWLSCLHPDDVVPREADIQKALKGENDYNTGFRIIQPDGSLKYIRSYGKVTRDANGRPLHMIGINYDITEHKQAENKLRESEQRYRSLFTEISEGFALHEIICDDSGKPVDYRILDINPAFEKMTGLTAVDVIGKNISQVLPRTEIYRIETYGKVALTGEPVSFEGYLKELDRHYQIYAFCPQKGTFAVLFTDITERKKMEARLIQAQKMEAIGTLAGGIAHDFNNILGAIIGYAGMAQEELPEGSSVGECIDEIFQASDRAKNLVAQILAFSRRDETARKPLMIVPVMKEIVKLLRAMLPSTIFIRQNIQVHDAFILADATQVHQVLLNLCTNAAHAMQEKGGTLTLGLKQVTVDEGHPLRFEHLSEGDYLELQVSDDGHGISEKIQNQIFDPFFTTKKTGEGTGMGLSVVHGIVQSYGGHIRLESQVGEGTTFFIYLPLLRGQGIQNVAGKVLSTAHGTERILIVDDQDFMVDMMSKSLSRVGYHVTAKNSSTEALQLFQSDPFAFDLVITDQTMPYLTGADMSKTMLQIRPGIPIILCTGYSATVSPEQAKAIGIQEYVMKPIIMKEFTRMIRKVLEENRQQDKTDNPSFTNQEMVNEN